MLMLAGARTDAHGAQAQAGAYVAQAQAQGQGQGGAPPVGAATAVWVATGSSGEGTWVAAANSPTWRAAASMVAARPPLTVTLTPNPSTS